MSSIFQIEVTAYTSTNDEIEKIEVTIEDTIQCEKLEVYFSGGAENFFPASTITKISDKKWIADFVPLDPDFFNNNEIFCNGSVGSENIAVKIIWVKDNKKNEEIFEPPNIVLICKPISGKRTPGRGQIPTKPIDDSNKCESCEPNQLDFRPKSGKSCPDLRPTFCSRPQYTVFFREPFIVSFLTAHNGKEFYSTQFQLSNIPIHYSTLPESSDIEVGFAVDARYRQDWLFQNLFLNNVVTNISLAPSEELSISLKHTQRKSFKKSTLESVEEMQSSESTITDKDVMNVTRATSETNKWKIGGEGSLSLKIGDFGLGVGVKGSHQKTNQKKAESSIKSINESTRKSAYNLKTMHKTEVTESTEETIEKGLSRKLVNPYDDRAISIYIFEILTHYCIKTSLSSVSPAIIINFKNLKFNQDFVLNNGGFLTKYLIDEDLRYELTTALESSMYLIEPPQKKAIEIAKMCLDYLFDKENIFKLKEEFEFDYDVTDKYKFPFNIPATCFDPSIEAEGFKVGLYNVNFGASSCWKDSTDNNQLMMLTILNMYYNIYRERIRSFNISIPKGRYKVPQELGDLVYKYPVTEEENDDSYRKNVKGSPYDTFIVDFVLSLYSSVSNFAKPLQEEKEEEIGEPFTQNLYDAEDFTEIYRRLSGFTSLVEGILKPLISPSDEEGKRLHHALFVVDRVVKHLNFNSDYYIENYLDYLTTTTSNSSIIAFVDSVLNDFYPLENIVGQEDTFKIISKRLDVQQAFVDKTSIVVPAIFEKDKNNYQEYIEELAKTFGIWKEYESFDIDDIIETLDDEPEQEHIDVPFDGVHFEVVDGNCHLEDIPKYKKIELDTDISFKSNDD